MFQSAQRIGKVIEKEYDATSLTIACQVNIEKVACVPFYPSLALEKDSFCTNAQIELFVFRLRMDPQVWITAPRNSHINPSSCLQNSPSNSLPSLRDTHTI